MASQKTTCGDCGVIFYYDDGFFSPEPKSRGAFSRYLCPNCANNFEEEKRHKERMQLEKENEKRRRIEHEELIKLQKKRTTSFEESSNYDRQVSNDSSSSGGHIGGEENIFEEFVQHIAYGVITIVILRYFLLKVLGEQTAGLIAIVLGVALGYYFNRHNKIRFILIVIVLSIIWNFIHHVFGYKLTFFY